ncbi:MAG TPA: M1 family metallopeptidase [Longimicrobium sp.]|jgi:hypothetical protein
MTRWLPVLVAALALALALADAAPAPAQGAPAPWPPARPVPNPLQVPGTFQRALAAGTRSTTGAPGPRYWQQWAHYRISTRVDAQARTLAGSETVTYHNRSPDTLFVLVMKLWQDHHAPGAVRNEEAEVTGGVQLGRVAVGGEVLQQTGSTEGSRYAVGGTNLLLVPTRPVPPGDTVRIEVEWSFRLARQGIGGRMGYSRDDLLYLAYWYPQMAVYDDVAGWQRDPFRGTAEFYMGYASYEYTVDAPEGWVVMGTGQLVNPEQVLAPAVLQRWRRAMRSDSVVHVLGAGDFGVGKATVDAPGDRLQWTFRADSVRDVAFGVFRQSLWDAARTPVGDRDGDGRADHALVQAFWRQDAPRWAQAVRYGQQSITHHSEFTGVRYPYPHMTAVEGEEINGGGMEYPMMTLIGSYSQASDTALYSVTSHELAHMWVPMIVGVDETRYGWMDEGTTDFNENEARNDFYPGSGNAHVAEQRQYLDLARRGIDAELLVWTDFQFPPGVSTFATYTKPAAVLWALRGLLGEETFLRGYRKYLADWRFRHPKPYDFFNAFNTAAGRDLGWFWSTWYGERWALDQAVQGVADGAGGTTITVEDRGLAPMPARLLVTRADGRTERREVPVETWLAGARTATVTLPAGASPVVRVEIDPEMYFPDVDRANNVWTRS